MNTKSIVLSIASIALAAGMALLASPVFAQSCTTQYGGSTTCMPSDLIINKQVQNPVNGVFVDNLTVSDPTFAPAANVLFQLTIQNTSGQTFDPVTVKDVFPSYLTFVSGPGTYDSGSNTLTMTMNNLIAGESRTVQVMAKVNSLDKSIVCVNNYAEARDDAVGRFDSDTAEVCLATNVLGTTTLPVAGFNDYLLLLPFAGVSLSGFALLKKPASTAKRGEKS